VKVLEIKDATGTLAHYARRAGKQPLIVMAKGKPVAALVPIPKEDHESIHLSANPVFNAILEKSWKSLETEGGISHEDMKRRLELKR
jgi:antitoxin (DNA-binding transcriptional repressor) of toxin-antitoxin stability system